MLPHGIASGALFVIGMIILVKSGNAFSARLKAYDKSRHKGLFLPLGPRAIELLGIFLGFAMTLLGLWWSFELAKASTTPPPELSPLRIGIIATLLAVGFGILAWQAYRDRQGVLLYQAVCDGDAEKVETYLNKGISIHRTFDLGRNKKSTYLHSAASTGQAKIAKMLIDVGAKVDARCGRRQTPLHVASQMGYVDVVKILLQAHADVNAVDESDVTPLHSVVVGTMMHPDFVRYIERLREQRPDSPRPRNALCGISHIDVASLLLESGANKESRDREYDKTPGEMAREAGLDDLAVLLA